MPDGMSAAPQRLTRREMGARLAVGAASAVLSVIGTASVCIAWVQRMAPPTLFYAKTERNRALVSAIPLLLRSYVPNLLSWNAHSAGFFGYVKLPEKKRPHSVERVTLPDGGTVCLSWSSPPIADSSCKPIILLIPGINNPASMPYIRRLMGLLDEEGLGHVAALDWRGLGEAGPLTGASGTPRPYCAMCAPDVGAVIDHLHAKHPHAPLYAVGWSLGGGMLLSHLGETGDSCLLSAAMAISPAIDLVANLEHMARRWHTSMYLPVIMAPLVAYFYRHRHALASGDNSVSWWNDVLPAAFGYGPRGIEGLFAKLWGLQGGASEYHAIGSSVRLLSGVRRSTLIVHASDDPICPVKAMPLDTMIANPHLITAITRHGGHMGYTAGFSPLTHTWTDRVLVHYLRHLQARRGAGDAALASAADGMAAGQSHHHHALAQPPPPPPSAVEASRPNGGDRPSVCLQSKL